MHTATERERIYDRPVVDPIDRRDLGKLILSAVAALVLFSLGWALGRNSLLENTYVRDGVMTPHAAVVEPAPVGANTDRVGEQ